MDRGRTSRTSDNIVTVSDNTVIASVVGDESWASCLVVLVCWSRARIAPSNVTQAPPLFTLAFTAALTRHSRPHTSQPVPASPNHRTLARSRERSADEKGTDVEDKANKPKPRQWFDRYWRELVACIKRKKEKLIEPTETFASRQTNKNILRRVGVLPSIYFREGGCPYPHLFSLLPGSYPTNSTFFVLSKSKPR